MSASTVHSGSCWRALISAVLLLMAAPLLAQADDWTEGRATFYDDNTQGSCHYGTNIPTLYAAWPPVQAGSDGSCGRCYEVACSPKTVTDRWGQQLDRNNICYDTSRTVVVKIVDSCPCFQNDNLFSNQRWCCGDQQHLDLGREAFKQLAEEKYGVIGVKWRQVSCDTQGSQGSNGQQGGSVNNNADNNGNNNGAGNGNNKADSSGNNGGNSGNNDNSFPTTSAGSWFSGPQQLSQPAFSTGGGWNPGQLVQQGLKKMFMSWPGR